MVSLVAASAIGATLGITAGMMQVFIASVVLSQIQSAKIRAAQAAAQDAADAAKGVQLIKDGAPSAIPVVYGRALVGGARVYHNTFNQFLFNSNEIAAAAADPVNPLKIFLTPYDVVVPIDPLTQIRYFTAIDTSAARENPTFKVAKVVDSLITYVDIEGYVTTNGIRPNGQYSFITGYHQGDIVETKNEYAWYTAAELPVLSEGKQLYQVTGQIGSTNTTWGIVTSTTAFSSTDTTLSKLQSYIEDKVSRSQYDEKKNHAFLITQQVLCHGGIKSCVQVDIDGRRITGEYIRNDTNEVIYPFEPPAITSDMSVAQIAHASEYSLPNGMSLIARMAQVNTMLDVKPNPLISFQAPLKNTCRVHVSLNGSFVDPLVAIPSNSTLSNDHSRATAKFKDLAYATAVYWYDADKPQYNGVPNAQFYIEGKLVKDIVKSGNNYSISSEKTYSNNPVRCLLDYMTNGLYGLGLDASKDLDLESFYNAAKICDTDVTEIIKKGNKNLPLVYEGGFWRGYKNVYPTAGVRTQKLFECNLAIDTSRPLRENIEGILGTMNDATLVWSSGSYKIMLQYPKVWNNSTAYAIDDVVQVGNDATVSLLKALTSESFKIPPVAGPLWKDQTVLTITDDNLVRKGDTVLSWPNSQSRFNFATVRFLNEEKDFKEDTVSWPDKNATAAGSGSDKGVWDPYSHYLKGDFVTRNNVVYQKISDAVLFKAPNQDPAWSTTLLDKGRIQDWNASAVYLTGSTVVYVNLVFVAKAIVPPSPTTPPLNTTNWILVGSTSDAAFKYKYGAVTQWDPSVNYQKGDIVKDVIEWLCTADCPVGVTPYGSPEYWSIPQIDGLPMGIFDNKNCYPLRSKVNLGGTLNASGEIVGGTYYYLNNTNVLHLDFNADSVWTTAASNSVNTVYNMYLQEDNGVQLEHDEFLTGITSFFTAKAKAEYIVRNSRAALTYTFTTNRSCLALEPGDIAKLTSDVMQIPGDLIRITEVVPDNNDGSIKITAVRFDANVLAWNVADDQPSITRHIYTNNLPQAGELHLVTYYDDQVIFDVAEDSSGLLYWANTNDNRVTGYQIKIAEAGVISSNTDWSTLGYVDLMDGPKILVNNVQTSTTTFDLPSVSTRDYNIAVVAMSRTQLANQVGEWPIGWPILKTTLYKFIPGNFTVEIRPDSFAFIQTAGASKVFRNPEITLLAKAQFGAKPYTYAWFKGNTVGGNSNLVPLMPVGYQDRQITLLELNDISSIYGQAFANYKSAHPGADAASLDLFLKLYKHPLDVNGKEVVGLTAVSVSPQTVIGTNYPGFLLAYILPQSTSTAKIAAPKTVNTSSEYTVTVSDSVGSTPVSDTIRIFSFKEGSDFINMYFSNQNVNLTADEYGIITPTTQLDTKIFTHVVRGSDELVLMDPANPLAMDLKETVEFSIPLLGSEEAVDFGCNTVIDKYSGIITIVSVEELNASFVVKALIKPTTGTDEEKILGTVEVSRTVSITKIMPGVAPRVMKVTSNSNFFKTDRNSQDPTAGQFIIVTCENSGYNKPLITWSVEPSADFVIDVDYSIDGEELTLFPFNYKHVPAVISATVKEDVSLLPLDSFDFALSDTTTIHSFKDGDDSIIVYLSDPFENVTTDYLGTVEPFETAIRHSQVVVMRGSVNITALTVGTGVDLKAITFETMQPVTGLPDAEYVSNTGLISVTPGIIESGNTRVSVTVRTYIPKEVSGGTVDLTFDNVYTITKSLSGKPHYKSTDVGITSAGNEIAFLRDGNGDWSLSEGITLNATIINLPDGANVNDISVQWSNESSSKLPVFTGGFFKSSTVVTSPPNWIGSKPFSVNVIYKDGSPTEEIDVSDTITLYALEHGSAAYAVGLSNQNTPIHTDAAGILVDAAGKTQDDLFTITYSVETDAVRGDVLLACPLDYEISFSASDKTLKASGKALINNDSISIKLSNADVLDIDKIDIDIYFHFVKAPDTILLQTWTLAKNRKGDKGDVNVVVDLTSESDITFADQDGNAYNLPPSITFTILDNNIPVTSAQFGLDAACTTTSKNQNNLIAKIHPTNGIITWEGATGWNTNTENFTFYAKYGYPVSNTYNRVYTFTKSRQGDATILPHLTQAASVISADSAGNNFTLPSGIKFQLYRGGVEITTGITFTPAVGVRLISNTLDLEVDASGTLLLTGAWTGTSEHFDITAHHTDADGVARNYKLQYSIVKAKSGLTSAMVSFANTSAIFNNVKGALTPSAGIILIAETSNITPATNGCKWYKDGSTTPFATNTSLSYTVPTTEFSTTDTTREHTYKIEVTGLVNGITTTVSDVITVARLDAGSDAYTIHLSNENVTIGTDSKGTVTSFTKADCAINVWHGTDVLAYSTSPVTGTNNGFWISSNTDTNVTSSHSTSTASSVTFSISSMTGSNGSVSVIINCRFAGVDSSFTKVITYSKAVGGEGYWVDLTGTQAYAYDAVGSRVGTGAKTITATAHGTFKGTTKYIFTVGSNTSQAITTTNTIDYTPPTLFSNMPEQIRVDLYDDTTSAGGNNVLVGSDIMSMIGTKPGLNSLVGSLTNDNASVNGNTLGVVATWPSITGVFDVYFGNTKLNSTDNGALGSVVTFSKSAALPVGNPIDATVTTAGGYTITAGTFGGANLFSASIDITASFTPANSTTAITVTKTVTISKNKDGIHAATIQLFKVDPIGSNPSSTTYDFSTGLLATQGTMAALHDGWSRTIVAATAGHPVYMASANVSGSSNTVAVAWSAPAIVAQLGSDSYWVDITVDSGSYQAVTFPANGTLGTAATIAMTANPHIAAGDSASTNYKWYVGGTVQSGQTAATYSYTTPTAYGSLPVQIKCEMYTGTTLRGSDTLTIIGVKPGSNTASGYLTNESITLPAPTTGGASSFTGASTTFVCYDGVTQVSNSVISFNGQTAGFSNTLPFSNTASLSGTFTSAGVFTIDTCTTDNYVDLTAAFTSSSGTSVTITKRLSVALARAGVTPQGILKSTMFARGVNYPTYAALTGSYTTPSPSDTNWKDGIPADDGTALWMTTRIFTSNGANPQQTDWQVPQKIGSPSTSSKVQFSVAGAFPTVCNADGSNSVASGSSGEWHSAGAASDIYMRSLKSVNNGILWVVDGTAVKIKGETGSRTANLQIFGTAYAASLGTDATYDFNSKALTGTSPGSTWGLASIAASDTTLVYVATGVALEDGTSGVSGKITWSVPAAYSKLGVKGDKGEQGISIKGDTGGPGKRTATGYVFYQSPGAPPHSPPLADKFNFYGAGMVGRDFAPEDPGYAGDNSWGVHPPSMEGGQVYYTAYWSATEDTEGSGVASGANLVFWGATATTNFNTVVTFSNMADAFTNNVTVIDGNHISTGTITADCIKSGTVSLSSGNFQLGTGASAYGIAGIGVFTCSDSATAAIVAVNSGNVAIGASTSDIHSYAAVFGHNSTNSVNPTTVTNGAGIAGETEAGNFVYYVSGGNYVAKLGNGNCGAYTTYGASTNAVALSGSTRAIDAAGPCFSSVSWLPFTGAHEGSISKTITTVLGDIVVDTLLLVRKDINNCLFEMTLSNIPLQKGVIGVVASRDNIYPDVMCFKDEGGTWPLQEYTSFTDTKDTIQVNALGEGQINVCGENGDIEVGDFIVTSSIPGKGMKQSDDIVRSITVARAREAVSFSGPTEVKLMACIYMCG